MRKKISKKVKKAVSARSSLAGMKRTSGVCPECDYTKFYEDESRGERTCARCGLVIEESMIDFSQEWRAFDEEQRSKRARTGAPLTFSVDYKEPIVIKENDEIKVVKIGEFVDGLMEENKDKIKKEENVEIAPVEKNKFFAVSFNENYNLDFYPITEVTRHSIEEIFEIGIEGGKTVRATGSHSVFTVKDNRVVKKEVTKIRKGDFVVAPKFLPSGNILEIDLMEEFKKLSEKYKNLYLRNISDESVFEELSKRGLKKTQIKIWKKNSIIPLHILAKFKDLNWKLNGETLGLQYSKLELPLKLEMTKKLCKLLGFYVAEGICKPYDAVFCFGSHEKTYINEIKQTIKSVFGKEPYINESRSYATTVEVNSKLLSILFSKIFGAGSNAKEKRIPSIIFSLPEEMKLAFIHGYVNGDGHVWQRKMNGRKDTQVGTSTVNEDLANDLLMLYLQLRIHANYCKALILSHVMKKTGQIIPDSITHMTRITNPDIAIKLGFVNKMPNRQRKGAIEELIPAPLKYKKEWKSRNRIRIGRELAVKIANKYNDKDLLKLAQAPFIFLRAKKIRKIKSTNGYAYDLTVPEHWNFIGKILWNDTKHDKGITTEIGKGTGELFKVSSAKRAQYYRLTKWQKRLIESKDRNLSFALSELQRLISFLGLHRGVHEAVAKKYEQAVDRGLVRGRSMESVIAALLYAICRETGTPRTLEEIAEASGVERREIGRTYRYIARELAIKILPAPPEHYVPRFSTMLGLSDKTQVRAIHILKKAKEGDVISGKGPTGVAAAALYIAAVLNGERKTQREIADAVGVTEVTIRNRFKEIVDKLGIAEEVEKKVKEEELE